MIRDSSNGRELRERGYEQDVAQCSRMDVFKAVPLLYKGRFVKAHDRSKDQ
ncbi:hypothetical protein [Paenibacillus elgii]|uniref:hypothetical protein n=1 Tax=Paenibacillus elgii TaxID=189691 RepID=UPI000AC7D1DB|nr:hypothetical protein [Paenibacillus elgii]NEN85369.1 hypothetical protein [Paenibacillus elgii]